MKSGGATVRPTFPTAVWEMLNVRSRKRACVISSDATRARAACCKHGCIDRCDQVSLAGPWRSIPP